MTIALGLVAKDGVVIAADRQETEGDRKKDERKIGSVWATDIGSFLVSGAGDAPYIDSMGTRLQHCFGAKVWEWEDDEEMTDTFRASHSAFYSEAVLPFAGYQPYERPDYELLFGCSIKERHLLWYSHKLTLNRAQKFRAVGIGASTAESMLNKFYVDNLPLRVAISLAAFVVYEVKNSVEGCGFETDVMFTRFGTPPCRVSSVTLQEMENAFAQLRYAQHDDLYKVIGGGMVPKNLDPKKVKKLRQLLTDVFDSFYREFDTRYAYKPESTRSTSRRSKPGP